MNERTEEAHREHRDPPARPLPLVPIAIVLAVLLAVCACSALTVDVINRIARDRRAEAALGQDPYIDRARVRDETVLVIGADDDSVYGFTIMRADQVAETVVELTVPADVMLKPAGSAAERLDDVFRRDPALAVHRLSGYLQIPIANWLVVPPAVYEEALAAGDLKTAFTQLTASNFPDRERFDAFIARVGALDGATVDRFGLPVRTLEYEGALYVQPHREEIAKQLGAVWGASTDGSSGAPRVVVLNGTDRKGFASRVARGLAEYGFQIATIGNAESDRIEATSLEARDGFDAAAAEVGTRLARKGVVVNPLGDVESEYDIAVIIGADYPELPESE